MARSSWVILQQREQYAVGKISGQAVEILPGATRDEDPLNVAAELVAALRSYGYRGEPTVLALDTFDCFAATFDYDRSLMGKDRQMLTFALEEYLPLTAEETVADFVLGQDRALGVAVPLAPTEALISALEGAGIVVQSISPAVLLAAQQLNGTRPDAIICWPHEAGFEVVVVGHGQPIAWRHSPKAEALRHELEMLHAVAADEMERVTVALEHDSDPRLLCDLGAEWEVVSQSLLPMAATTTASGVLRATTKPFVELRRDALAATDPHRLIRGPMWLCVLATTVLWTSLIVSLEVMSWRYRGLSADLNDQQRTVFAEVFPGSRIPVGVRSRLESELHRREGLTGQTQEAPILESAALRFQQAMSSLPSDLRYRILQIRLDSSSIFIEGQARTHSDAERIAATLRGEEFDVEPPSTENLPGEGVSMTIGAAIKESSE